MEHRGQQGIGRMMARDVDDGDSRGPLASFEFAHDVLTIFGSRSLDPRLKVEAFLEVDVDDMIPAGRAIYRNRPAIHIETLQRRDFAGKRQNILRDFLKVFEFARQKLKGICALGFHTVSDSHTWI